jgi:acetyl-CoA carboxylase biotin carboxyl carrier protein
MALSHDDVREILRIIDESELDELRIETDGFRLHVRRDGAAPARDEPAPAGEGTIAAPMVGTFYRASAPGAAPFVDVGSTVEPDTVVGLIEVMKMMNSIPAGVSGTIAEVCVDDAQVVEEGAPLFRVA